MRSHHYLTATEEDNIKHRLTERLIDMGWRDRVKDHCYSVIAPKRGRQVSIDQLIIEITPFARSIVPPLVKSALLESVREACGQARDIENYEVFGFLYLNGTTSLECEECNIFT